jgi:hypothetical protein
MTTKRKLIELYKLIPSVAGFQLNQFKQPEELVVDIKKQEGTYPTKFWKIVSKINSDYWFMFRDEADKSVFYYSPHQRGYEWGQTDELHVGNPGDNLKGLMDNFTKWLNKIRLKDGKNNEMADLMAALSDETTITEDERTRIFNFHNLFHAQVSNSQIFTSEIKRLLIETSESIKKDVEENKITSLNSWKTKWGTSIKKLAEAYVIIKEVSPDIYHLMKFCWENALSQIPFDAVINHLLNPPVY